MAETAGGIALEGVRNFRDIGGLPAADGRRVRAGRYFRSGHLAAATDADRKVLDALGIKLVVDLRSTADIEMDGMDVLPEGARWVQLQMTDPARSADFAKDLRGSDPARLRELFGDGRGDALIASSYRTQVVERFDNHRTILHDLLSGDGLPAVVHCAAGKDRAGIAAALVQRVLGVPDDAIMANYLESNLPQNRYEPGRGKVQLDEETAELFRPFLEVRADYLVGALEEMDTHWGSFDAYVAGPLAMTESDVEALRAAMLD